ncbi:MAG TPA: hypothetical protein VFO72_06650 [Pyrinomonadaceae bacterium]|nr:hypothetical protein [Pyrinomonadaceae bacterium]
MAPLFIRTTIAGSGDNATGIGDSNRAQLAGELRGVRAEWPLAGNGRG